MYNRYIPQSDGTYRRHPVQDPSHPAPAKEVPPPEPVYPPPPSAPSPPRRPVPSPPPRHRREPEGSNVSGFLRQLLPKDFDTGDLLVVLLLLLMAGDSQENQNSALLTLGLYLFL